MFSLINCFIYLIKILRIIVPSLIAVAYFTLAERKIIASIQRRRGPNVVGLYGLLQPLADGLKLLLKETVLPSNANIIIFIIAPVTTFALSLLGWAVIPFGQNIVLADINLGILYLFAISSLGVYGIIIAGWSSNSKYAFLGAVRTAAQIVSYEVSIGFIVLTVTVCAGSQNLSIIVIAQEQVWYVLPLLPIFVIFFISALAETNRPPFDLPEAEAELVAGYNVEYSAIGFALFFLGEYANMILISSITVLLFLGGWLAPFNCFPFTLVPGPIWFGLKTCIFVIRFIWARAAYPRYRYDRLISLGWKTFLPLSLGWLILTASYLIAFNGFTFASYIR